MFCVCFCALKIVLQDCNWLRIDTVIFRFVFSVAVFGSMRSDAVQITHCFVTSHISMPCYLEMLMFFGVVHSGSFFLCLSIFFLIWILRKKNEKCSNRCASHGFMIVHLSVDVINASSSCPNEFPTSQFSQYAHCTQTIPFWAVHFNTFLVHRIHNCICFGHPSSFSFVIQCWSP